MIIRQEGSPSCFNIDLNQKKLAHDNNDMMIPAFLVVLENLMISVFVS